VDFLQPADEQHEAEVAGEIPTCIHVCANQRPSLQKVLAGRKRGGNLCDLSFIFILYRQIINNNVYLTKEFSLTAPFCGGVGWEEK